MSEQPWKLVTGTDVTVDGRFWLQKEHLHHEGVFVSIQASSPEAAALLRAYPENGWYGPGGRGRAQAALRRIYEAEENAPRTICPDGGTCHHTCAIDALCFRVETCGPLSGVYPNDEWPRGVR